MIADDLSRIAMSSTLATALSRAMEIARAQDNPEVTLQHIVLALCEDPDAGLVLAASNVDLNRLKADALAYLSSLPQQQGQTADPIVSADLRRILEAAAAAARGGRRREINGAIVLAAIVGDGKSPAAHMLQAQGLTFEGAIRALQRAASAPRPAPASTEDILASARERVQSRSVGGFSKAASEPEPVEEEDDLGDEDTESGVEAAPAQNDVPPMRAPEPPRRDAYRDEVPATRPPAAMPGAPNYDDVPPTRTPGPPTTRSPLPFDDVPPTRSPAPLRPAREFAAPDFEDVPPTRPTGAPRAPDYGDVPPTAGRAPEPERGPQPGGFRSPLQQPPQPARAPPAPARPAPPPPASGPAPSPGFGAPVGAPAPFNRPAPPPYAPAPRTGPGAGAPQMRPPPQSDGVRMPPSPPPPLPSGNAAPPWVPPQGEHAPNAVPRTVPPPLDGARAGGRGPGAAPPGAPPAGAPGRTIMARAAGPSQAGTPDIRRVNRQAPRIEIGQLVENIPRTMRVAVPALVEVRVARNDVQALAEGLQGGGAAYRHEVTVTKAMSVRLRAPDGGFYIETASPETQWIEKTALLSNEDYASWRWHVTPREKGRKRLQLIISARTVSADGLAAETALPDQVITVRVRTNYGRAVSHVVGWSLAALIGGLIARFGEGAFDAGVQIIAKLMKT